jgi:hypothetical protein
MALWRMPSDYLFGTLSQAAAVGDTSISSASFASMPSNYTTSAVLPVVLHNPSTGVREVVWVTAHTAAATSATVVRGKENTTAQAWPSGTQWIVAPTAARDGLSAYPAATLNAMTDQHVGMRALETDSSLVKHWTYAAGWQAEVGACRPADCGPTFSGGTVPAAANILTRVGCVNSATPSSNIIPCTFATPFPNGVIAAFSNSVNSGQFIGTVTCESLTVNGMNLRVNQISGFPAAPGIASLSYVAYGW